MGNRNWTVSWSNERTARDGINSSYTWASSESDALKTMGDLASKETRIGNYRVEDPSGSLVHSLSIDRKFQTTLDGTTVFAGIQATTLKSPSEPISVAPGDFIAHVRIPGEEKIFRWFGAATREDAQLLAAHEVITAPGLPRLITLIDRRTGKATDEIDGLHQKGLPPLVHNDIVAGTQSTEFSFADIDATQAALSPMIERALANETLARDSATPAFDL